MSNRYEMLIAVVFVSMAPIAFTQSKKADVTITEPSQFSLSNLFSYADKVAVVKVIAGTTEAYDVAMYKGQVVEAFKGASVGELVYFGPYVGMQIGSEYVLFLKDQTEPMHPRDTAVGYGIVRYSNVFDEGYSSMLTSYECVFDGASPGQRCEYAVRVCTDYILLPKSLPTSPNEETDTPFGCRWVKRDQFISELGDIAKETR
jgi:hypothetical protein